MWKVYSLACLFPGGRECPSINGVWRCGVNSLWYCSATVQKTNGCHLSPVPEASRKKKKTLSHYHLWKYMGCTFYSFSSAIFLLSSRISKVHFIIPAVMAGVHLWHKIIPWIFLHHFHSGNVFKFQCVSCTLNNSIRNYIAVYHAAEYQY